MRLPAIALVVLLTACASVAPPVVQEPVLVDRLFCGLSIPDGGAVSEEELKAFVDEVVVARFPEGFSVYRIDGVYRGAHEPSFVIEIIHKPGSRVDRDIVEIAEAYRKRFRQIAVLRVTMPAGMNVID